MVLMCKTMRFVLFLLWCICCFDRVSSFVIQHRQSCKLFVGLRHTCLTRQTQPSIQYYEYFNYLRNNYIRIRKRTQTQCSESDLKDVTSSPSRTETDSSGEPVIQSWVTNTARNFLINLFGTSSPFRRQYETQSAVNSSSNPALVCDSPPDSDLEALGDRPRADRFLSVIRSGVRHGLFDGESEERDWTNMRDERVNREEFGEAVMAAGLSDGIDIDDLFEGMDADHDGELR